MRLSKLAVAYAAYFARSSFGESYATLTLLDNTDVTFAKCMDGSPGGFYFEKATSSDSANKWIFDLEGGGECADYSACHKRASQALGSSKYFPKSRKLRYLASGDEEENPYAYSWNRVFLKYCSSDLWSGTRTNASAETFGLYFSGHNIVQAVFAKLLATTNLSMASDVVVTGESAGGIGTWINVGWVKDQLPNARTVAAPIAGFYAYAYKYTGPAAAHGNLVDFSPGAWPHHYNLWRSHVDRNCQDMYSATPWFCMLSNNSRPAIDVPAFVIEAQTDQVQLEAHDNIPPRPWDKLPGSPSTEYQVLSYVQAWKLNMSLNLHTQLRKTDGIFSPACYIHTAFSKDGPLITDPQSGEEYNFFKAFGKWHASLWSSDNATGFRLEDSCGLFCGKRCHTYSESWTQDSMTIIL